MSVCGSSPLGKDQLSGSIYIPASVGEVVPVAGAIDVGLGAGGPEDGADVLPAALVVRRLRLPGQRAQRRRLPEAHRLEDLSATQQVVCVSVCISVSVLFASR